MKYIMIFLMTLVLFSCRVKTNYSTELNSSKPTYQYEVTVHWNDESGNSTYVTNVTWVYDGYLYISDIKGYPNTQLNIPFYSMKYWTKREIK